MVAAYGGQSAVNPYTEAGRLPGDPPHDTDGRGPNSRAWCASRRHRFDVGAEQQPVKKPRGVPALGVLFCFS